MLGEYSTTWPIPATARGHKGTTSIKVMRTHPKHSGRASITPITSYYYQDDHAPEIVRQQMNTIPEGVCFYLIIQKTIWRAIQG